MSLYIGKIVLYNLDSVTKVPGFVSYIWDSTSLESGVCLHIFNKSNSALNFQFIEKVLYGINTVGRWEYDKGVSDLGVTGVKAGIYKSLTIDSFGKAIAGSNPTTLNEYGIIDAQPLSNSLTYFNNLNVGNSKNVLTSDGTKWISSPILFSNITDVITDVQHGNRTNGTLHGVATSTVNGFMSNTDKTKLDNIAFNSTQNSTDAMLRARSTHTGTQPFSTITGTIPINQGGTNITTPPMDGQLLIGNSSTNSYNLSTLSVGTGINISNTAGNITLSVNESGLTLANIGGVLPITKGGTGSTTLSWVNLSTNQTGIEGNKTFTGTISSSKYILGADLSLIPVIGGQSTLNSWWGLQLVGNRQSNVDYIPTNVGAIDSFSVLIPNQKSNKIGLIVQGAVGQTGLLQTWRDSNLNTIASIDARGQFSSVVPVGIESGGTGANSADIARFNLGITAPAKNALINPAFTIAQRGVSFDLSTNSYILDRWAFYSSAGGGTPTTGTVSQLSLVLGQTGIPGEPEYCLRVNNTSVGNALGSNSYVVLSQAIESVRTFAEQDITISFYARSSITNKRIVLELTQNFGTGGSPSSLNSVDRKLFTLTNSWQRYTATFTVSSLSGKTIGTNNNDSLGIAFYFQAGTGLSSRTGQASGISWGGTGTTDIANVQLELGNTPTNFEYRTIAQETMLCNRYLQIITASHRFIATGNGQYGTSSLYWNPMRTIPTSTLLLTGVRNNIISVLIQSPTNNGGRIEIRSSKSGDTYVLGEQYLLDAEL